MASIFTLKRMAEKWPDRPPLPNWSSYAVSLADYAEKRLSREETRLPQGTTLRDWLYNREDGLRKDPYQRELNEVIAYSLLPLFESNPEGWNIIRTMPNSPARFHTYLCEWSSSVYPEDQGFMKSILDAFQ